MSPTLTNPATPDELESELARECSRSLSPFIGEDLRLQARPESGETFEVKLPAVVMRLLVSLLAEMAEGNTVTLVPIHAELTTQQAADLLGVSRPFLIKRIEEGVLPHKKVGTHRRILFRDLMAYKERIDQDRLRSLEELSALGQELDLE